MDTMSKGNNVPFFLAGVSIGPSKSLSAYFLLPSLGVNGGNWPGRVISRRNSA